MAFALVDIDRSEPFPGVQLGPDEDGVGIVIRDHGRPRTFFMKKLSPGIQLTPRDFDTLIAGQAPDPMSAQDVAFGDPASLPSLTVAICTREHPDDLATCLDRLLRLRAECPHLDVLVIDNAPVTTATRDVVNARPGVRYALEPKGGLDFARNRALRESDSVLISFIDDDVAVDWRWLQGLARALALYPDAKAVTGLVLPLELRTESQILFEHYGGFEKGFDTIRYGPTRPGHPLYPCIGGKFGTGCNMCFVREHVVALGGFDDALDTGAALPGGGDTDMLYRIVRAGGPLIFEPSFLVWHRHRRDHAQLMKQYCWSWGQGLMAFVTKTYQSDPTHRPQLRRLVAWWAGYQLMGAASAAFRGDGVAMRVHLAQLWGGIVGLSGAYQRSVRRTNAIRAQWADATDRTRA